MSHFQFIFAITALVVTGTLVFTFLQGKDGNTPMGDDTQSSQSLLVKSRESFRPSGHGASAKHRPSSTRSSDHFDLGIAASSLSRVDDANRAQVNNIVRRTSQDAHQELDDLTKTYDLSSKQRKELFPYIVAHHKQAHPSMLVAGQNIPSVSPDSTLEESLYPILNEDQKNILAEAAIEDDAWWKDVVGQLETDLDNAIEGGEMVAATEEPSDPSGSTEAEGPTTGDGEASSHSGENLFDLLGQ